VNRSILTTLLLALAPACAWAPGMRMDEAAVRDRAGPAREPGVEDITPALLAKLVAQAREAGRPRPDPLGLGATTYEYRIAPFDVLGVTVWDHPELTNPAGEYRSPELNGNPVRADGTMFYPHVGIVAVAGKTVGEVRQLLTERLARVVHNPQLDVRVVTFRGKRVQVAGEVPAPATLPVTDVPMRVQDALAQAKGVGPEADLSRVTLTRGGQVYELDLQALHERGDLSQNWLLVDGDVVHVPDRSRNKVFIMGEVKRQSARPMLRGRLTLAEAIGDAEGLDQTTTNGVVYVIRGPYERPTVYRLDASSPDALLLAVQFPLRPADVIFVSQSALTRWNRVMGLILPTVRGLWEASDMTLRTRAVIVQ
jgi:polysaccharide export outer membrane protein